MYHSGNEKITEREALPVAYREDLKVDETLIKRFAPHRMIWLLRSYGTVLVPVGVGADPTFINYWISGRPQHGQVVKPYLIDPESGSIDPISDEKTIKLSLKAPASLAGRDQRGVASETNRVLERGCELGLWGLFKTPRSIEEVGGWSQWLAYFRQQNNEVMAAFMTKALRLRQEKHLKVA